MASMLATLLPTLAPIALDLVGNLFGSGKNKERESETNKYKAMADAAMAQLRAQPYGGPPPGMMQQSGPNYGSVPMPTMPQFIPQAVDQFQQAYQQSNNPIFAGMQVARSLYDNRDKVMQEGISTARGIGGMVKDIWSKFWDNKEEIMGSVMDSLQKRPRLA